VLAEVMARATQTLEWVKSANIDILSIALDHLTLGRAHLYCFIITYPAIPAAHDNDATPPALSAEQAQDLNTAASELAAAVDGLRRAGAQEFIIRGLLTRAWLRRLCSQLGYADVDGVVGFAVRTLPDAGLDTVRTTYPTAVVGWADAGSPSTTQAAANDGLPNVSPSYCFVLKISLFHKTWIPESSNK